MLSGIRRARVGHVRVKEALVSDETEDASIGVLDVAPKLVTVLWKEFGVAHLREVQDLGHDAGNALVSGLKGYRRSLVDLPGQ